MWDFICWYDINILLADGANLYADAANNPKLGMIISKDSPI